MTENSIGVFVGSETKFKNIAIAIKLVNPAMQQRHLGLFLKPDGDNSVKLLHLAWHNDFRLDDKNNISNDYFYLPTFNGCEETLAEIFVDWLITVWEENRDGLPYSIIYNNTDLAFDASGKVRELSIGEGFTCSTFVLECFKSQGYDLIKYETWPSRPEDKDWSTTIFSFLERTGSEPAHIQVQRTHNTVTRYRPEEVAAAASLSKFDERRLCFEEVIPLSCDIVRIVS
ncbi:hypothetical protein SJ402_26365 [Klebsiella variicola]|uniref:hypothetical protein n=1 Tax=Klebsiella variicola TaxID=244366 RepID=UPI0029D9C4A1|nr:hypothetical protein [Klebsiella variicola]MDX7563504.1 hypothetical protein [Klebsiella variicola]